MNIPSRQEFLISFCNRLTAAGIDHDALLREAKEVVVFGSRCLGVNHASSDLDVLCITTNKRKIKSRDLDCICLHNRDLDSWLGSELASHIATYGVCLIGNDEWRSSVHLADQTIDHKQRRIAALVKALIRGWAHLHPVFRAKYKITLRRELQRLDLLYARVPIPPTPLLDSQWEERKSILSSKLIETAVRATKLGNSPFVEQLVIGAESRPKLRKSHLSRSNHA